MTIYMHYRMTKVVGASAATATKAELNTKNSTPFFTTPDL